MRIDSSAASKSSRSWKLRILTCSDRPFVRQAELTPASSGYGSQGVSPISVSGPRSPFRLPHKPMTLPGPVGPPSPEFTNLDCAFPPFPTTTQANSTKPELTLNTSNLETNHIREHANSHRGRGRSPVAQSAVTTGSASSRELDLSTKPTRRSASRRRRPSLADIFGVSRSHKGTAPPLPSMPIKPPTTHVVVVPTPIMSRDAAKDEDNVAPGFFNQPMGPLVAANPLRKKREGQRGGSDASSVYTQSSTRSSKDAASLLDQNSSNHAQVPSLCESEDQEKTSTEVEASKSSNITVPNPLEQLHAARRPPQATTNGQLMASLRPPLSPNRSQTFPTDPSTSDSKIGHDQYLGRPHTDFLVQGMSQEPMEEARDLGAPSTTQTSRRDQQHSTTSLSELTAALEAPNTKPVVSAADRVAQLHMTASSHYSSESGSSYGSFASFAQSGSSRSSPPPDDETRRKRSNTTNQVSQMPGIADLPAPLRPFNLFHPLESPTDPLLQQGKFSAMPIPEVTPQADLAISFPEPLQPSVKASAVPSMPKEETRPALRPALLRAKTAEVSRGICRGCSKSIISGQKSVSSKDGRLTGRYHKECLACWTCRSPFATADFYVMEDRPHCAQHYHELNGSICAGCSHGIEGQYCETSATDQAPAQKYHQRCFTCSHCHITIQGDYYELNGKVLCERDAYKTPSSPVNNTRSNQRPSPLGNEIFNHDEPEEIDNTISTKQKYPERRTTKVLMI